MEESQQEQAAGGKRKEYLKEIFPQGTLDAVLGDTRQLYWELYKATREILQYVFGEDRSKSAAVNIRELAEFFGIEIAEVGMNSEDTLFLHEVSGYVDAYDYEIGNYHWTIYVNESLGELSKRYVIAHEFAHFVINQSNNKRSTKYCINMMLAKSGEELICDIMAAFFLMPLDTVLLLLKNYVDSRRELGDGPIDMYDGLRHIAYRLELSDYHTAICYQYIRNLGGILYQRDFKDDEGNLLIENISEYEKLFR